MVALKFALAHNKQVRAKNNLKQIGKLVATHETREDLFDFNGFGGKN